MRLTSSTGRWIWESLPRIARSDYRCAMYIWYSGIRQWSTRVQEHVRTSLCPVHRLRWKSPASCSMRLSKKIVRTDVNRDSLVTWSLADSIFRMDSTMHGTNSVHRREHRWSSAHVVEHPVDCAWARTTVVERCPGRVFVWILRHEYDVVNVNRCRECERNPAETDTHHERSSRTRLRTLTPKKTTRERGTSVDPCLSSSSYLYQYFVRKEHRSTAQNQRLFSERCIDQSDRWLLLSRWCSCRLIQLSRTTWYCTLRQNCGIRFHDRAEAFHLLAPTMFVSASDWKIAASRFR